MLRFTDLFCSLFISERINVTYEICLFVKSRTKFHKNLIETPYVLKRDVVSKITTDRIRNSDHWQDSHTDYRKS
jgi:hypothetical protein